MKKLHFTAVFIFTATILLGQTNSKPDSKKHVAKLDTINPHKGNIQGQLNAIKAKKILLHSDSISADSNGSQPHKSRGVDTTVQNKYGDLLKDDPKYNKRYAFWKPLLEVMGDNFALSLFDSKVLNYDWAQVSLGSWNKNFDAGFPWSNKWDWDQTRFGNDFLGHPMFGSLYFNDARSNGYSLGISSLCFIR